MIALIEMPAGTAFKFEVTKTEPRMLRIDRELPMQVPYSYGFIEGTLAEDGDALDVFVLSRFPIPPMTLVEIEPIALLRCTDNGVQDDKIIARIKESQTSWDFMWSSIKEDIVAYLQGYKSGFEVHGWAGSDAAQQTIERCKV